MVFSTIGTVTRFFFACSTALRIASGTSPALPMAKPTLPLRSPTTTSALKLNRLPPLTTLATRFTRTTVSSSPLPSRSRLRYCIRTSTPLHARHRRARARDRDTCIRRDRTRPRRLPPPWPLRRWRRRRPSPHRRSFATRGRRRATVRASMPKPVCVRASRRRAPHRCGAANAARTGAGALAYLRFSCAAARGARAGLRPCLSLLRCLSGLTEFLADPFAFVADAFALIRLRLAQAADLGRYLSNGLLVDAVDVNLVLPLNRQRDALGRLEGHGVREAEAEIQPLAGFRNAIADAADLETLAESLAYALDHVCDQRPRKSVRAAVHLGIALALHEHLSVVQANIHDVGEHSLPQLALGTLHVDLSRLQLHLDSRRNRDRQLTYARHCSPYICENLSSDAALLRALARHDALRRRDDHETEA